MKIKLDWNALKPCPTAFKYSLKKESNVMTIRKEGFYWVKVRYPISGRDRGWEPARFVPSTPPRGEWFILSQGDDKITDKDMAAIGPRIEAFEQ